MSRSIAAPAGEPVASPRIGDTPAKSGFGHLRIGSIGVVYGDIGTSPLYALREAVLAATPTGNCTK